MAKLQAGIADPNTLFNLNGLDYKKGIYEIYYLGAEQDSNGDLLTDKILVGVRNQVSINHVIQYPVRVEDWDNGSNTPYSDLTTLVTDLSDLLGFDNGGGVGSGINITQRVGQFDDLADGTDIGDLAYVEESQGTAWLPLSMGGTYYPAGWYVWDGTVWSSDRNAIANQLEQNILAISGNDTDISQLQTDLSSEVANRQAADNGLQSQITDNDSNITGLQNDKANSFDLGDVAFSNDFNDLDNIPTGVQPYFGCTQVTTEENGGLNNNQMEHSFGNGASSGEVRTHGQLIPYRSRLDYAAISAVTHGNALTQVEIYVQKPTDTLPQPTGIIVDLPNNDKIASYFYADDVLEIPAGSLVTYRTIQAGTANVVVMTSNWVHLDQNPNITTTTPPPVTNDVTGTISYVPFFGGVNVTLNVTNVTANPVASWCLTVLDSNWTVTSDFGQVSDTDLGNGDHEFCNVGFNGTIASGATITVQFQVTTGEVGVQSPTDNGVV